jgi:hypothetical protein
MECGRESKIYLGKFEEMKERWRRVAESLQEKVWQAGRILKPLENERWSQKRAST